jgi:hypothetical protein
VRPALRNSARPTKPRQGKSGLEHHDSRAICMAHLSHGLSFPAQALRRLSCCYKPRLLGEVLNHLVIHIPTGYKRARLKAALGY